MPKKKHKDTETKFVSRPDPAVENLQKLLTAMDELLLAIKAQQEMITLMARYLDTVSRKTIEIGEAVQRLEVKP